MSHNPIPLELTRSALEATRNALYKSTATTTTTSEPSCTSGCCHLALNIWTVIVWFACLWLGTSPF